jgi:peptide/nickel transport system substrate-binding protein
MSSQEDVSGPSLASARLTRREVLKGAAGIGTAIALSPVIAACGGGTGASPTPSGTGASGTPKKGGNLRVGISGGSAKDNLDGQMANTEPENAIRGQIYDGLMGFDENYKMRNELADEVTPNADATIWTIRIKQGVVFHDGKPVTADDVVYSFKRIINPEDPKTGAQHMIELKTSGIRKIDDRTVEFRLESPNAAFTEALAGYPNVIVPIGYDPMHPIGTGPFKLTNALPGMEYKFAPNESYWGQVPAVDSLTLIEFTDAAARVNALLSDSVDAISQLPTAQVSVVKGNSGLRVLVTEGDGWQPFTMRIDQKPFDDVRVRQAFRLIVDRPAMITQAYAGFATLGNDMYSHFDPGYPKDLPQRHQDLEQAKSLLKAAGYDGNLTVTLMTSDAVGSGAVAAAQVFAQQAKDAGVTVNVNKVDSSIFYGDQYLKWTFAQDYYYTHNYLYNTGSATLPTAPYNECHWEDAEWLRLVEEAFRTADDTKRNALISEAMTIEYNTGGYIIAVLNDQVDAYSAKLGGVVPDKFCAPLSSWHLNRFYFV